MNGEVSAQLPVDVERYPRHQAELADADEGLVRCPVGLARKAVVGILSAGGPPGSVRVAPIEDGIGHAVGGHPGPLRD